MKTITWLYCFLAGLAVSASAAVNVIVSGGGLRDAAGNPLPPGSIVALVASTQSNGFQAPAALSTLQVGASLSGDDVVLAVFPADAAFTGVTGGFVRPVTFDYSSMGLPDLGAGDQLALYWFPASGLSGNQILPNATYGLYRTDERKSRSTTTWSAPDDAAGGTVELNFFTQDIGGDIDSARALADRTAASGVEVAVTVQTSPAGLAVIVDGTTYRSPQTFSWIPNSTHSVSTTLVQGGETGVQYAWTDWSDGGGLSHPVSTAAGATYTARFKTQYFLTMNGEAGGTVSPGSGWRDASEIVPIAAVADRGYSFNYWTGRGSGSYTGLDGQASVTMNGPIGETANFTGTGSGDVAYINSFIPGNQRNDYSGWVGLQIVVGPTPLQVSELGRITVAGNSGTHIVKLVNASDGTDVAGGAVAVTMNGGIPGQFRYGVLNRPVTLSAGATYWLMSLETFGGDSWHDWNTTFTTTGVALANSLAWGTGPGDWRTSAVANQSYGPVNFRYAGGSVGDHILTVTASNPNTGVDIAVSPADKSGMSQGTVTFTRTYAANTMVTLTAPATAARNSFEKWQRDGVDWSTNVSTTLSIDANHTMTAVYSNGTPFIAGAVPGNVRNDYSGWVGMQIVVGADSFSVAELGRYVDSGNSGTHVVKVVKASDGTDVPGGQVTITTRGATPGQFQYGAMIRPVTLEAGTTYWVLSQEFLGGDTWHDWNTTITPTAVAAVNSLAWGTGPGDWRTAAVTNQTYGPVNFKYTRTSTTFATSIVLGEVRNDYSGWVGVQIVVGPSPLTITELGRIVAPGNVGSHTLKLVSARDGSDVPGGSVVVAPGGGTPGQFRYGVLANPVTLSAGATYWLMSLETFGGDTWYDWNTTFIPTGVASTNALAWGTGPGDWRTAVVRNQMYGPVNFKY